MRDSSRFLATNSRFDHLETPAQTSIDAKRKRRAIRAGAVPVSIRILYLVEPFVAGLCLLCLSPLLAILAGAIWTASGRPPLVAHKRVGRYGKPLWVYKFRTMWHRAAQPCTAALFIEKLADERPVFKSGPDPRVTSRFASFCRRHSLDELPQLALVAAGRMSIVGPRPLTRFELFDYYEPETNDILSFRPGLTGLWQIRGRSRLTYRQRKQFDLFLVRHFSIGLYLQIAALTIPDLIVGRNAW